jgi:hypothetical protein
MPLPRYRLGTLMIAVAVVALALSRLDLHPASSRLRVGQRVFLNGTVCFPGPVGDVVYPRGTLMVVEKEMPRSRTMQRAWVHLRVADGSNAGGKLGIRREAVRPRMLGRFLPFTY